MKLTDVENHLVKKHNFDVFAIRKVIKEDIDNHWSRESKSNKKMPLATFAGKV
jgi:hypothetical protein